jgi:histidinol-phosphate aminotransferase
VSIFECLRPELQTLQPYEAAEQVDDTIRLNANEAPWNSAGGIFRRPLNRYPEVRPGQLADILAKAYGCTPANLVITRGSSEGIDLLIRSFCRAGKDSIVTTTPTFSMYRHYARIQEARVIECRVTPENNFAIDIDALLAACDDSTRIVFLCSPNNPTGNTIARADLERVLDSCRDRAAVVVDEAYIEFSAERSVIELLETFDNLIVLRTLSKALACAGARCGCVIANPAVARVMAAVQAPYALATPVVECVENTFADDGFAKAGRRAAAISQQRDELIGQVCELPFVEKAWPSDANFFLVKVKGAAALLEHCATEGILLRGFTNDLSDCIRITVGSREENLRLLQVMRQFPGAQV